MRRGAILSGLVLAMAAAPALAHVAAPQAGWRGPEPWALVPALLAAGLYALGHARLRARAGRGRPELARRGTLFAAGWLTLAAAALSPLHDLGARSFTAHMAEHELLMLAAAPLLVMSRPLPAMLWALPAVWRGALGGLGRSGPVQALWRTFSDPLVATVIQAAVLWIWHLPSMFDRALKAEAWHAAQHICFLVAALFFWSAMLGPRRSPWMAAACLFVTSMATGALGAFMALSQSPWYGPYASLGLAAFNLTPAQDQQLAGALMWVPGGLLHALVAVALLAPQLRSGPKPAERAHA